MQATITPRTPITPQPISSHLPQPEDFGVCAGGTGWGGGTVVMMATSLRYHPPMAEDLQQQRMQILAGVVQTLLADLKTGSGDKDRRRQVEEWMRTLAEKYPEFKIETGLRDYYLAEAERLRGDFDKSSGLAEELGLGRSIESFLDRAAEYDRRIQG